jgi:hypothetical protein
MATKFDNSEFRTIYSTFDYSEFKRLTTAQRKQSKSHVANIMNSLNVKALNIPIMVNENLQIIEGNHLFEARKNLKLPILFYIENGYAEDEMRLLNLSRKNWNFSDIIGSYRLSENTTIAIICNLIHENKLKSTAAKICIIKNTCSNTYTRLNNMALVKSFNNNDLTVFNNIKDIEENIKIYKDVKNNYKFCDSVINLLINNKNIIDIEHFKEVFLIKEYRDMINAFNESSEKMKEYLIIRYNLGLSFKNSISIRDLI